MDEEQINVQNEHKVSSIETVAREQGWKPIEEFDGDKSKWVSAETFVAKGELIAKIESLGKKLKDSDKAIKMLTEHHQKVKESEFKRAVEYLKAQKKQAYETGDVDKIIEIDDKIAEVKETQKAQIAAESVTTPDVHPSFQKWQDENKWYTTDTEMRADADAFGNAYAANNPDKTPEQVLEYVSTKIKKVYKDKFENPNRSKASAVEGGGNRQETGSESFALSEDERRVMRTFVRTGVMSEKEYIAELKKVKGIE